MNDQPASSPKDSRSWVAWIGGACAGNPGPMAIGGVLRNPEATLVLRYSRPLEDGTSNLAAWRALQHCLELAIRFEARRLTVYTASRVLVDQFSGACRIRDERLWASHARIVLLAKRIPAGIDVRWISGSHNEEAAALARRAIPAHNSHPLPTVIPLRGKRPSAPRSSQSAQRPMDLWEDSPDV